jgi:predicted anti-sigma-YlaC factor YlaD
MANVKDSNEMTRLIVEAITDVLALAGLITLAALKPDLAASLIPIIALIAGARVGSKARSVDSGDRGGIPPTSGAAILIFAFIPIAWSYAKRHLIG